MSEERLQKVLAAAGIGSRRECEELIIEGVVRVNGIVVNELPVFVNPQSDVITVNGRKVRVAKRVYYLLNKPEGVVCADGRWGGRRNAIDLIGAKERIFCAGRIDVDTSGVVIFTNDSELAGKLSHPRCEVAKTYVANVKGVIDVKAMEKLRKGIWLSEGRTGRASIKILRRSHADCLLEITIREERKRGVRRMLERVGLGVKSLKRTRIGRLSTEGVGVGRGRPLSGKEVEYLKKITCDSD